MKRSCPGLNCRAEVKQPEPVKPFGNQNERPLDKFKPYQRPSSATAGQCTLNVKLRFKQFIILERNAGRLFAAALWLALACRS